MASSTPQSLASARSAPSAPSAPTPAPSAPTPSPASSLPMLLNVQEYARHAAKYLPRSVYDYYRSGAHDEQTLRDNVRAYQRLRLRPRVLVDVSKISLDTTVLGHKVSSPLCIAPTAMQRMAHPDGEEATARAAQSTNSIVILSSLSTTSIEDFAKAAPHAKRWFQLYVYKDRAVTQSLVRRAEASSFSALVLTVDTPQLGVRERDVRNNFKLPAHLSLANFVSVVQSKGALTDKAASGSGLQAYAGALFDRTLSWKDIAWLRSITKLPIVLKGIMTAEDTELAVKAGVQAIVVSNHGARQLDGVAATIEALPEVVRAAGGRLEVYLDGGVRRGTDVLKAVALGAKAVFVGRPVLWGLSYAGETGVRQVISLLNGELELAMALAGCPTVASIDRSHVTTTEALRPKL